MIFLKASGRYVSLMAGHGKIRSRHLRRRSGRGFFFYLEEGHDLHDCRQMIRPGHAASRTQGQVSLVEALTENIRAMWRSDCHCTTTIRM